MTGTLCSSQAVLDKTGLNINSGILASEAIIDRYINQAEQLIVGKTRRDWVVSYSDLLDSTKAILESTCAAKVAKEIIASDMSGFQTKAEAITKINVNESEFQAGIRDLKELDIVKIRSVS